VAILIYLDLDKSVIIGESKCFNVTFDRDVIPTQLELKEDASWGQAPSKAA
jgi:hypothetical protein